MTTKPDTASFDQDDPRHSISQAAGARGEDDRRQPVNPSENPAPRSPEGDQEAITKGEETLERVKPY